MFWATLGGMGLTGAVLDARLQLRRTETAYVNAHTERCRDLDEALERIARGDKDYEYAVAWIDCLARGRSLGRSILLRANPARVRDLPARMRSTPHANTRPFSVNMPFYWPSAVLNRFSMRMFNAALFRVHRESHSISHCNRYFYPLDRIGHWNRIYGKRGVLQYQLVLPRETAREGLAQILERTTRAGHGSFMAVLKSTGPANGAPLSFPIEGVSLALDFPNTGSDLLALLKTLDRTVINHGGRVYLAKDSTLGPEDFRMMYPRLDEFRAVKEKYDPEMRFSSSQARRLRIVDAS